MPTPLTWSDIKVGLRVICIDPGYNSMLHRPNSPSHPDVYHHCGVIRSVLEGRNFYITWDDPFFNTFYRGTGHWSNPNIFAQAMPTDDLKAKELQKQLEEQRRRQEHAMKYL